MRGLEQPARAPLPAQGRFHVLKYLAGLAARSSARGGTIFCGTRVEKIEGGSPAMVTTATSSTVAADDVVVCTNGPISDMVVTHMKQAPYRTFVVAFARAEGQRARRALLGHAATRITTCASSRSTTRATR